MLRKIRAYDPRGYIVFITNHSEKAPLTFSYRVEALDFISKDEPDKRSELIYQCMVAASFKELESLLDSRFFRCHKSILANLDHAVSYQLQKRRLLMDNEETCSVSMRVQSALKLRLKV